MAEQTTSFSTSGEDAITRVIDVKPDNATNNMDLIEFDEFYEIKRTAEEIIKGDYKKVRMLLCYAHFVTEFNKDCSSISR